MQLPLLTIISKSTQNNYVGLVEWVSAPEFAGKGKPRKYNNSNDPWIHGRAVITQITSGYGSVQILSILHKFQENQWKGQNFVFTGPQDNPYEDRIQAAVDNWRKAQNTSGGNNP